MPYFCEHGYRRQIKQISNWTVTQIKANLFSITIFKSYKVETFLEMKINKIDKA